METGAQTDPDQRAARTTSEMSVNHSSGYKKNPLKQVNDFHTYQHLEHLLCVWVHLDELLVQSRNLEEEINLAHLSSAISLFYIKGDWIWKAQFNDAALQHETPMQEILSTHTPKSENFLCSSLNQSQVSEHTSGT